MAIKDKGKLFSFSLNHKRLRKQLKMAMILFLALTIGRGIETPNSVFLGIVVKEIMSIL